MKYLVEVKKFINNDLVEKIKDDFDDIVIKNKKRMIDVLNDLLLKINHKASIDILQLTFSLTFKQLICYMNIIILDGKNMLEKISLELSNIFDEVDIYFKDDTW